MLLNQAVLLRGVNDSPAALVALSERLFEVGVMPYYLHQLDPDRYGCRALGDHYGSALPDRLFDEIVTVIF